MLQHLPTPTRCSVPCASPTDRKISELLAYLDRPGLHPFERAEALDRLRGMIAALWGMDEIR